MSIDRTTETIFHFVGHFDLTLEQLRLRAEYDEFKAKAAVDADAALIEMGSAQIETDYELKDYDPELKYKPVQTLSRHTTESASAGQGPVQSEALLPSTPGVLPVDDWIGPVGPIMLLPQMMIPIPSSVVTITIQSITLFDADQFGTDMSGFTEPAFYHDQLVEIAAFAESLAAPFVSPLDGFDSVRELYGDGIADLVKTFEAPKVEGLETAILRDEDVEGAFVDGEAVDELPEFDTLLPAAIRAKRGLDEEDAEGDGDKADALPDYKRDPTVEKNGTLEAASPWDDMTGHRIHTGMNEASNEVALTTSMIDAGVIVVGGDVFNLISVSQVNVASDHDVGTSFQDNATTSLNIAEVLYISDQLPDPVDDATNSATDTSQTTSSDTQEAAASDAGPVDMPAPPSSQSSSIGDSAQSTQQGTASSSNGIGGVGQTGENGPDDSATPDRDSAPEAPGYTGLPQYWTVDTYEGDVIQLNSFTQASFALDSDRVDFSLQGASTFLGTGENILFNQASAIEIGFGYDLIIVSGDMIDMKMVSQINVLLDDDKVYVDGQIDVSGADNLLLNHVSIKKHGLDSYDDIEDNFEDALDDLEDGIEDLSDELTDDDLFEGIEGLRALYITGDLIKITTVSQTNVLGDQDQVKLALKDFEHETKGMVEVVTGSNVLTNSAMIEDLGFDSVVMTAGDVYDDALLYQAELIDTDAAPTGVDLYALANEAVAFLADDMLIPDVPDAAIDAVGGNQVNDAADVLQTMTA